MLTVMTCLAFLAALRAAILQRELARFELVRGSGSRGVALELHRRAMVCRADGDTQEFPLPREARMLVLRVVGVPILCRREEIGLPLHLDARLGQLRAEDFDSEFTGQFRVVNRMHGAGALTLLWRA